MSRAETFNKILRSLQSGTPEIEACALISEDGLLIASALPRHFEEVRVGGISATLLSLGERVVHEVERGRLEQVLIKGDMGYVVMSQAHPGTMLVVITNQEAKLGLIFLDMHNAISQIKKAFTAK